MPHLIALLQTYGVLIVFAIVLVEQAACRFPPFRSWSWPARWRSTAASAGPRPSPSPCGACLITDLFWFRAGRFYGKRILSLLCRISLSPDYCVSQTEDKFRRYGPKSLIVSKFIPGFNTIASPMSGALGCRTPRFLAFSISGSLLWSGTGIALGAVFHESVDQRAGTCSATMGTTALLVLLACWRCSSLYKYVERRRFRAGRAGRAHRHRRTGQPDRRAATTRSSSTPAAPPRSQLEQAIPGALIYDDCEPGQLMATLDKDRHIVVYCSCPNDVTAAQVAKQFLANGFHRARPLHGGLDAWNAHHGQLAELAAAVDAIPA